MQRMLTIAILVFTTATARAQPGQGTSYYGRDYLGASFTYLAESYIISAYNDKPEYHQFTYRAEYAHRFGRQVLAGMDVRYIRTLWQFNGQKGDYWLAGIFGKFIFVPGHRFQFFLEATMHTGNYCTCGESIPYQRNGLLYIGYGGGFNAKISPRLHLELALLGYRPISKVPEKPSAYGQYIVGLGYTFDLFGTGN